MRRMTGFLFLFLLLNNAFADNLCDTGCSLNISFPSGGRIDAVDDLTLSFGNSAQINTVNAAMAPVAGDTLKLNAGENLEFAPGGNFKLGNAGNVDFKRVMIHTDGIIELSAIGGAKTLIIPAGSSFVISSKANIVFDAQKMVLEGVLTRDIEQ
jgi:hypothetical protein